MIIFYAGHYQNKDGDLYCLSNTQQFQWVDYMLREDNESMEGVDALAILDCCYADNSLRNARRSSQVLAACNGLTTVFESSE